MSTHGSSLSGVSIAKDGPVNAGAKLFASDGITFQLRSSFDGRAMLGGERAVSAEPWRDVAPVAVAEQRSNRRLPAQHFGRSMQRLLFRREGFAHVR